MVREWFTAAELAVAELADFPTTKVGVIDMANRQKWRAPADEGVRWRKRIGRGGGFEYHYSVLPEAAQLRLLLDQVPPRPPSDDEPDLARKMLWRDFDRLTDKKKGVAQRRAQALLAVRKLVEGGGSPEQAVLKVAAETGLSKSAIYRHRQAVHGVPDVDWLPLLAPQHCGRTAMAAFSPEAWEACKADWLRPEAPNLSDCYRRLVALAAKEGWQVPSLETMTRRLQKLKPETVVLARQGAEALKRMYPAQERSREHFHALEAVNADGHKWDVFVRWPDGWIGRPQMVAIQDLFSGMLLSWRVDKTANKEAVRLAIGDVVEQFGIFRACWLDNGRDFASKWITGGTRTRYRFKPKDEDPVGLLGLLGVKVHWTTPYSGQSKPIERAFRDMAQSLAKHPRFAGAYVGNNPMAKPENYGSTAVPLDVFLATVGEGIAEHNLRVGRQSKVCGGRLSFAQAFSDSYAKAAITKATAEQRRLWLLAAEAVKADRRDGAIVLEGNRYWGEFLSDHRGQRVTVRFDPQALQEPLHVYRADGGYLGAAQCVAAAGFDDVDAAREHGRQRKAWMRAQKQLLAAERTMSIQQLAAMLPGAPEPAPLPETKVVRPFVVKGGAALKQQPQDAPEEDLEWLEAANRARRAAAPLRLVEEWTDAAGDD